MIFAFATYGLRLFCCATRAAKKGAAGKTSSVFLFCRVGVSFCVLSVVAWADMQAGSGGPNGGSGYPRISCVLIRVLIYLIYRALTSVYPAFATHGIAFRRPYDRTASLCFLSPDLLPAPVFFALAAGTAFLQYTRALLHPVRPFPPRPTHPASGAGTGGAPDAGWTGCDFRCAPPPEKATGGKRESGKAAKSVYPPAARIDNAHLSPPRGFSGFSPGLFAKRPPAPRRSALCGTAHAHLHAL